MRLEPVLGLMDLVSFDLDILMESNLQYFVSLGNFPYNNKLFDMKMYDS